MTGDWWTDGAAAGLFVAPLAAHVTKSLLICGRCFNCLGSNHQAVVYLQKTLLLHLSTTGAPLIRLSSQSAVSEVWPATTTRLGLVCRIAPVPMMKQLPDHLSLRIMAIEVVTVFGQRMADTSVIVSVSASAVLGMLSLPLSPLLGTTTRWLTLPCWSQSTLWWKAGDGEVPTQTPRCIIDRSTTIMRMELEV
jgi:hypothetical protein